MSTIRALVVGGTGGIGQAIARHFADTYPQGHVTIAGRNAATGEAMTKEAKNGNIDFQRVDASLMKDVKRFCKEYSADVSKTTGKESAPLDVLVLSPGILTTQGRSPTEEGLDVKMALHYYCRMLFIRELQASGMLAPTATVMSILDGKSSNCESGNIKWDDLDLREPGNYTIKRVADHCLAMTDVMLQDFAQSFHADKRIFIHAYPGFVHTNLFSAGHLPAMIRWGLHGLAAIMAVSPETCAERMVHGMTECQETVQQDPSKRWFNINDRGQEVSGKAIADAEKRHKVAKFTWETVDGVAS
jgi:hypothetical protein